MQELRWNPLLATYTMVAANRQDRPHLEKGSCPFCIGSGKVPDAYDILVYDNDFPVLKEKPDQTEVHKERFFKNAPAKGKCEVILYSSDHNESLGNLPLQKIEKLIELWADRFRELSADEEIAYIFPFENKGEEVGVTMHHPHGQLYAYSFVPFRVKTILDNARAYYEEKGQNLFDDWLRAELEDESRIIWKGAHFVAFLPYFTDYPYGVCILPYRNIQNTTALKLEEKRELAGALKKVLQAFDALFDRPFPYMKCIFQNPVNVEEYKNSSAYFRFHIQFFPPLRAADKIKWMASSETGAGASANPLCVEETAGKLRKFINHTEDV